MVAELRSSIVGLVYIVLHHTFESELMDHDCSLCKNSLPPVTLSKHCTSDFAEACNVRAGDQ